MGLAASERDGTQASLVGVLLLFGLSLGIVFTCRIIHTISASHKRAHTLSLSLAYRAFARGSKSPRRWSRGGA